MITTDLNADFFIKTTPFGNNPVTSHLAPNALIQKIAVEDQNVLTASALGKE
jgi:hypothetical protein